ncbi:hypothetical protein [Poseidonibacter lekithochrous]|uniref:hypothetical protein n=1 Tax=Poseidonibacter lekithochrous TaxID=1904463 RepID=UPI000D3DBBD5|nr:hypothetical protein [Poseidonibacter lekithochrous]
MLGKKFLCSSILCFSTLFANDCSPYYNPDKFYEAPEYLQELMDTSLKGKALFGEVSEYKSLDFIKDSSNKYTNKSIRLKDYKFPKQSGLYSYKIKNKNIDEIEISTVNLYRYTDVEIAEEINNDFEGFWSDWIEDGYEMQLVPEQILLKYNDKYFTFSVFIYGVKGDTTRLEGTSIKYWMKDYTVQVNEYIECSKRRSNLITSSQR